MCIRDSYYYYYHYYWATDPRTGGAISPLRGKVGEEAPHVLRWWLLVSLIVGRVQIPSRRAAGCLSHAPPGSSQRHEALLANRAVIMCMVHIIRCSNRLRRDHGASLGSFP